MWSEHAAKLSNSQIRAVRTFKPQIVLQSFSRRAFKLVRLSNFQTPSFLDASNFRSLIFRNSQAPKLRNPKGSRIPNSTSMKLSKSKPALVVFALGSRTRLQTFKLDFASEFRALSNLQTSNFRSPCRSSFSFFRVRSFEAPE